MRYANRGFQRPWRLASSTVCSAAALLAASCGGDASDTAMLAEDVGLSLAAETAEVEDALAAADYGAAQDEALDLRDRIDAAIEAGEIPDSLQRPLLAAVNRLIESIPKDEPPPEDEEKDEEKDGGKDEDDKKNEDEEKDNRNGEGEGNGDTGSATTTDVTTTTSTDVTTTGETVTDGSGDG